MGGGSCRLAAMTTMAMPATIIGSVSTSPIVIHPNARYPRWASGTRTNSTLVRATP